VTSEGLHEPAELLSVGTIDAHRGYVSLIEELEAIDWYNQRVEAATDDELARVLTHSRDEEKEHAMMTLEWLRRHDETLDANIKKYVFSDQPLPLPEGSAGDAASETGGRPTSGSLGIGSLRDSSPRWGEI
jgi:ferritin-like protein